MSYESPMISLCHDLTILAIDSVIHQAMDAESICHDLAKYVAIIILGGQQESTLSPDQLTCHIINVTMLIVQEAIVEIIIVVILEHLLEEPLKCTIILPDHRLLCRKFHR